MEENFTVKMASFSDIEILSFFHVLMFKEVRDKLGKTYSDETYDKIANTHKKKLMDEMPKGMCYGWFVENENSERVSSGQMSVYSFAPSPETPESTVGAYIHSIYTDKKYRGKKLSTMLINEIIRFCKERGINRLLLAASDSGKPIYEAIGFEPKINFMTKVIS